MNTQTTIRLYGEVQGTIWRPHAECTKDFDVRLVRVPHDSKTRTAYVHGWPMEIACLRDALLHITNDGDFQSCGITYAVLEVTHTRGSRRVSRIWEMRGRGENADCFVAEARHV